MSLELKKPLKPEWLKVKLPSGEKFHSIKKLVKGLKLATVCEEANCPNISECWEGGTATLMLMGDVCTRGCRFCNVKTGNPKGVLDEKEPEKVSFALSRLDLDYVVLTSVDRDDLEDEGAGHFAKTVKLIKERKKSLMVEVLTPDFKGKTECLDEIISSKPEVFAHNVETVKRLQRRVRDPRANYEQSLKVLSYVKKKAPHIYTKTSLMLGLGEEKEEVLETMRDLRSAGCDIITFGQYLRPRKRHLPVERYLPPEEFETWKKEAENLGFLYCASGPLVRSSYKAGELFLKALIKKNREKVAWE